MSETIPIDAEDRRLVREYLAGRNEQAFRALYRRHTDALYAMALRLLDGHAADAEDVVQEAWVIAARGLESFRWRSTLRTWLTGIAINCARNRYRHRARTEARTGGDITELPSVAPLDRSIEVVEMQRAIDSLPDGYREVLLLHDVHGHTHEEIAGILGISPGTSRSQLSRARSTMRRRLGETEEDHERRSL